jgi:hypothetical protein
MAQAEINYLFHALCRVPFAHCVEQSARPTCWKPSYLQNQRRSVESPMLLFPGFRGLDHNLEGG